MTAEERRKRIDELSVYMKEKNEIMAKIVKYMDDNPRMIEKEKSDAYRVHNFHFTLWKHAFNELNFL